MARKATDLLDVFRFSNEDENDDRERKTNRKAQAAAARKKKAGKQKARVAKSGDDEGIQLSRRHLLLASSAVVLLLVLSFTLGLAKGRVGDAGTGGPSLKRETPVVIRAQLPLVDPANSKPTDPDRIRRRLRHEYGLQSRNLKIWKEGAYLVLEVGPFRSKDSAVAYLRSSGLELAHINMEDPFRWPQFLPYQR